MVEKEEKKTTFQDFKTFLQIQINVHFQANSSKKTLILYTKYISTKLSEEQHIYII